MNAITKKTSDRISAALVEAGAWFVIAATVTVSIILFGRMLK